MISFLRGRLAAVDGNVVIVDVAGVGYAVSVPAAALGRLPKPGQELTLYTSMHVREDSWNLYGFTSPEERRTFELLLGVAGVGPKLALAVLSAVGPAGLSRAVLLGDAAVLARVPGVGKKTAQRLILELKGRLGLPEGETGAAALPPGAATGDPFSEAAEALAALGYSGAELGRALEAVRRRLDERPPVEDIIRHSLRELASAGG